MNFLYEGRYPEQTIGSTLDKSDSINIKIPSKKGEKKAPASVNFTELATKHVKGCYNMSKQLGRNSEWGAKAHTQASYNPSHDFVERKTDVGMISMDRNLSRENIPPGRPSEYANTVE